MCDGVIRCEKKRQDVTRNDKKLGVLELILKLPNENSVVSNLVYKV